MMALQNPRTLLAINCGSWSLKFGAAQASLDTGEVRMLATGLIGGIGGEAEIRFREEGGGDQRSTAEVADHAAATRIVLDWLSGRPFLASGHFDAIGHRIVHGGDRFKGPAVVTPDLLADIESLRDLAPLHNGPSLAAIRAAQEFSGPSTLTIATFDTAFHRNMPEYAVQYPIPLEMALRHGIRRFGFHGLAHEHMMERYSAITKRPKDSVRLITLQLGSGCSAAAISQGQSIDTSMGLTPLEGLMMGTRCGDIDPTIPGFLASQEGVDIEHVENVLNMRSGLLGISGRSQDVRELLSAEAAGDARAGLALDMFCYRVRKYIGAYLAALGGADAIIFSGGIGENSPEIRARICTGLEWCGIRIDESRNRQGQKERRISSDASSIEVWVLHSEEVALILRDTLRCLQATAVSAET